MKKESWRIRISCLVTMCILNVGGLLVYTSGDSFYSGYFSDGGVLGCNVM